MPTKTAKRRVCFVTGSRAEFGLMRTTLEAIGNHPRLELQIIATGMHLSGAHGNSLGQIKRNGWKIDATIPWSTKTGSTCGTALAMATGQAIAKLALVIDRLKTEIVLVVGDRVEAFAGATAGHLSGRIVAHVHGGDRALGQVDDALRHAITKLAHLHFPATEQSKQRILRLGEDVWRVHQVGAPGIDGIADEARSAEASDFVDLELFRRRYALVCLHPVEADPIAERNRAGMLADCLDHAGIEQVVFIHPNNDPGWQGIAGEWERQADGKTKQLIRNVDRGLFLALMKNAALMVGNSSAGIIEAGSFGTPVIDIGPRQKGREYSLNVITVPFRKGLIQHSIKRIWNNGKPTRFTCRNVYGGSCTGHKIATILGRAEFGPRWHRKLIAF